MKMYSVLAAFFVSFFAAFFDTTRGVIPNELIRTGFVAAFCAPLLGPGVSAAALMQSSFLSALLVLCWKRSLLGGGDVKLFSLLFFLLPGKEGTSLFVLSIFFAAAAVLAGAVLYGSRRVRLGGAAFLAVVTALCFGGLL